MLLHLKKAALGLKEIHCESIKHCPETLFLTGVKEKGSKAKVPTYSISKSGPLASVHFVLLSPVKMLVRTRIRTVKSKAVKV